ncbi:MAG: D-alanine--D-alanine ligase [Ruminococcus sp.]|jgi:D-alanine-D-alanine ligase|nr:D-alanine--D-alanine ligase [Ruminococcus sp.]
MSKLNLAVIFGGMSNEHEISLKSAVNVIKAVPEDKYNVIPIGITKKGRWLFFPGSLEEIADGSWEQSRDCTPAVILPDPMYRGLLKYTEGQFSVEKIDAVFPVMHGKTGEDGVIQGLLELSGIPFVGCRTTASAVCMDKTITHAVLERAGIKMARYAIINRNDINSLGEYAEKIVNKLGLPVFVKPAESGSSVGCSKANDIEEFKAACKTAFSHGEKVICEEYIKARELECAVFGSDDSDIFASDIGEILSANEFYDFDAKYINAESKTVIHEDIIENGISREIRETALKAFKTAGCRGLARVDFFLKEDGTFLLNEINTMPGFTEISMYPKLMEAMGIPATELVDKLIRLAIEV